MGTVLLQDYNNTDIDGYKNGMITQLHVHVYYTSQPLGCMHREGYSTQFLCLSVTTVLACLTLKV